MRQTQRRFSMREAFVVLDLAIPKIKGADQAEVNVKLKEWKNTVLKSAYRTRVKEVHPDQNATDPEADAKFKDVREAFEQIRDDLKINLKRPPPPKPVPNVTATVCPACATERLPENANFCYDCGTDYNMDALERRLRNRGLTDKTLKAIKTSGTYERLRKLSPVGSALQDEITLLVHRQRLGLYGEHSGWS